MPNLTPEQQAKADALMKKARVLYEAIVKAKPPQALAFAIRDGVAFEKLGEESIVAVAQASALYEKGLGELVAALSKVPDPEPGAATKVDVKGEKVAPPTPDAEPPAGKKKAA